MSARDEDIATTAAVLWEAALPWWPAIAAVNPELSKLEACTLVTKWAAVTEDLYREAIRQAAVPHGAGPYSDNVVAPLGEYLAAQLAEEGGIDAPRTKDYINDVLAHWLASY